MVERKSIDDVNWPFSGGTTTGPERLQPLSEACESVKVIPQIPLSLLFLTWPLSLSLAWMGKPYCAMHCNEAREVLANVRRVLGNVSGAQIEIDGAFDPWAVAGSGE